MARIRSIGIVLACAAALAPGPARPADPPEGAVSKANRTVSWTGHFRGAAQVASAALGPSADACINPASGKPNDPQPSGPNACDVFALTVEGGGADIELSGFGSTDDVDLYVHVRNPDGTVGEFVTQDGEPPGTEEHASIAEPGTYWVFAAGYLVANSGYEGTATFVPKEPRGIGRPFEPLPISQPAFAVQPPSEDPDRQRHVVEAVDGANLYVETWLPKAAGKRTPPAKIPTILVMTPYVSQGVEEYSDAIDFFVSRGYAVAQHHVRGTGESGGCLEQTGRLQIDDGARVVEYLGRDAPWTDGNVGMYGISYDAETQISIAGFGDPERIKYLKAIIPASSVGGQYEYSFFDGVPYMGWALGSNAFYLVTSATPGQTVNTQYPQKLDCQADVMIASADQSGDVTPFWQEREYRPGAERIKAATFMVHGLSDFNVLPMTEAGFFDRLPASTPHRGLFGIWEHAFPDSHSTRPEWNRFDWMPMALAWYDRYLKGLPTSVESWPPVQVQGTDGQWRAEPSWPSTGGPIGQLAFGPGGKLGVSNPTGSTVYAESTALVAAEPLSERAVFETGPLKERLEITGQPVLDAWVSLDQPDAHFVAEIETFDAAGDPIVAGIDWGMRSARHLDPLVDNHFTQAEGKPAPTDTPINVQIRFLPTNLVIPKGGSLRLTVSGLLTIEREVAVSGFGITSSTPSGAMTAVTILHDCDHPTALRFLTPRLSPDLLKVRDARPDASIKPSSKPPLSDGGGVATAAVCGKAPLRLDTFGPARAYGPPAPAKTPPKAAKPAPAEPNVLEKESLPATGVGGYQTAGLAMLVVSGLLFSRRARRRGGRVRS